MKEVTFIRQNIEKWRVYETIAEAPDISFPDEVADAYIDVTSDLAFAQTHYPRSRITLYLNNLASVIHANLYRNNRREPWTRIFTFWTQEMSQIIWNARRELRLSFAIFMFSVLVGVVSQLIDPDFARLILGDHYVDMTIRNIENGHPMAVYGSSSEESLFGFIPFHNIRVAFYAFAGGLFTSFATGYILLFNGLMMGSFQTFFVQYGLLGESALAIWLHGTLEISAIIVAGAAGLTMGNGWLFPGTYSRLYSFRRGARRGLKIVVGTIPLFVLAGFIESYWTRHTEWPTWLRLTIILLSFTFIIYYYILLPYLRHHGTNATED